ncbi:MAG: CopD family protein [Candidatus Azotimanducaceae bacterium]|uniref:Protoporphyrinogen IX oxidase n=1 Tax=OM182 bacterium TaxID=2510334 RepID=A0A520S3S1_9GAMM|nr:MAG: CopD family protein [OM182 bacterium]
MLWITTAHLLFVMAWLAGLFYLPRLFVHYVEGKIAGEDTRRLVIMATKLVGFSFIMGSLACFFGIWLWLGYGFSGHWLQAKLFFVAILLGYHLQCYRYVKQLEQDKIIMNSLFFRAFNEIILLIIIPILILVVMKPF